MSDIQKQIEDLEQQEKDLEAKQQELEKIKQEVEDYESQKSALEKELERIKEQIRIAREEKRQKDETVAEKLRAENFEKAKSRIIQEFGYSKPEDIAALENAFKKIDDGSITEDNLYQQLLKAHLLVNPDKYLKLEKELAEKQKAANELTAKLSTSAVATTQPSSTTEVPLTQEDIEAAKWAGIPLEKYRELKLKGKI